MRLQMHATDPRVIEFRLGEVAPESCIRIPVKLNVFLDVHGVLNADYEEALATDNSLGTKAKAPNYPLARTLPCDCRFSDCRTAVMVATSECSGLETFPNTDADYTQFRGKVKSGNDAK